MTFEDFQKNCPLAAAIIEQVEDLRDMFGNFDYSDTGFFYEEVADISGHDYDDVKEECWEYVPEVDEEELWDALANSKAEIETYLLQKYHSLENLKSLLEDDDNFDDIFNDFQQTFDTEGIVNDLMDEEYHQAVEDAVDAVTRYDDFDDEDEDEDEDEYDEDEIAEDFDLDESINLKKYSKSSEERLFEKILKKHYND